MCFVITNPSLDIKSNVKYCEILVNLSITGIQMYSPMQSSIIVKPSTEREVC